MRRVRRAGRVGSAVTVLTAVAVLGVLFGGCGASDDATVERRGSAEERSLEVVNGLDAEVGFVPFLGGSGTPVALRPGERARTTGPAESGRNDLCAVLGRGNQGVVRVGLRVAGDVMRVSTPPKCPGQPEPGQPQAIWQAGDLAGVRLLDSGTSGAQLCLEREGRLAVSVRIEPTGTAC